MSGYNGWSKSNNAVIAESEGKYTMSHAKKIVAEKCGISQSIAASLLKHLYGGEYHHTSKHYNCNDYYDTRIAIAVTDVAKKTGIRLSVIAEYTNRTGFTDRVIYYIEAMTAIDAFNHSLIDDFYRDELDNIHSESYFENCKNNFKTNQNDKYFNFKF